MSALLSFLMTAQLSLLSPHGEKAVVLLFVRTDCPISNRYAPELQRIYRKYSLKGFDFRLVYPETGVTPEKAEKHRREYGYTIPTLLDAGHEYVTRARARFTPEAAVFIHGQLIYLGRIDDRYVDIGKARPEAEHHDLEEVLAAVVAGKSVRLRETKAVGCAIENLQ
jgi:thiol-disulfide isomerase/thioredoxin